MDRAAAAQGLELLCDALDDCERETAQISAAPGKESDDDADADCPIFESFYIARVAEAIMKMTNFTQLSLGIFRILFMTMS